MWLRLEGLLLAVAAVVAYRAAGGGWAAFVAFLVLPDLVGLVPFVLAARGIDGRGLRRRPRPAGTGGLRPRAAQDAGPLVAPRWFLLYNAVHSTALPVLLGLVGWWATGRVHLPLLGWLAHIGLDRALGVGLRLYPYLRSTHLQVEEAPLPPRW